MDPLSLIVYLAIIGILLQFAGGGGTFRLR